MTGVPCKASSKMLWFCAKSYLALPEYNKVRNQPVKRSQPSQRAGRFKMLLMLMLMLLTVTVMTTTAIRITNVKKQNVRQSCSQTQS